MGPSVKHVLGVLELFYMLTEKILFHNRGLPFFYIPALRRRVYALIKAQQINRELVRFKGSPKISRIFGLCLEEQVFGLLSASGGLKLCQVGGV